MKREEGEEVKKTGVIGKGQLSFLPLSHALLDQLQLTDRYSDNLQQARLNLTSLMERDGSE